jgi:hypothetical protein
VSAAALLRDLAAAGIQVSRAGDQLYIRAAPGIRLTPFVEVLRQAKPELLAELLKADIIAAVTVDPAEFDRAAYERLFAQWSAIDPGATSA